MYFGFDANSNRAYFSYNGRQFFYSAENAKQAWYKGWKMYRERRIQYGNEFVNGAGQ